MFDFFLQPWVQYAVWLTGGNNLFVIFDHSLWYQTGWVNHSETNCESLTGLPYWLSSIFMWFGFLSNFWAWDILETLFNLVGTGSSGVLSRQTAAIWFPTIHPGVMWGVGDAHCTTGCEGFKLQPGFGSRSSSVWVSTEVRSCNRCPTSPRWTDLWSAAELTAASVSGSQKWESCFLVARSQVISLHNGNIFTLTGTISPRASKKGEVIIRFVHM